MQEIARLRGDKNSFVINQPSHRTLKEAGDAFLLLWSGARGGMLRGLEALWYSITGAALHRGAFGGGGLAHLLLLYRGCLYNLKWVGRTGEYKQQTS